MREKCLLQNCRLDTKTVTGAAAGDTSYLIDNEASFAEAVQLHADPTSGSLLSVLAAGWVWTMLAISLRHRSLDQVDQNASNACPRGGV